MSYLMHKYIFVLIAFLYIIEVSCLPIPAISRSSMRSRRKDNNLDSEISQYLYRTSASSHEVLSDLDDLKVTAGLLEGYDLPNSRLRRGTKKMEHFQLANTEEAEFDEKRKKEKNETIERKKEKTEIKEEEEKKQHEKKEKNEPIERKKEKTEIKEEEEKKQHEKKEKKEEENKEERKKEEKNDLEERKKEEKKEERKKEEKKEERKKEEKKEERKKEEKKEERKKEDRKKEDRKKEDRKKEDRKKEDRKKKEEKKEEPKKHEVKSLPGKNCDLNNPVLGECVWIQSNEKTNVDVHNNNGTHSDTNTIDNNNNNTNVDNVSPSSNITQSCPVCIGKQFVYVSDLSVFTENGWGPVEFDRENGEKAANDGGILQIDNQSYEKGFGVHVRSSILAEFDSNCFTKFESEVGAAGSNNVNHDHTSVIFNVLVDGQEKFESPTKTYGSGTTKISLDMTGASKLQLVMDGKIGSGHGIWGDAKLMCA
eukprot:Awhi_evm1s2045